MYFTVALKKSGIQRDQFNTLLECLEIPHSLPSTYDRPGKRNLQRRAPVCPTKDQGVQTADVSFEGDIYIVTFLASV